ncbi:MAG: hypothetical protein WC683_11870 [bacterium]
MSGYVKRFEERIYRFKIIDRDQFDRDVASAAADIDAMQTLGAGPQDVDRAVMELNRLIERYSRRGRVVYQPYEYDRKGD